MKALLPGGGELVVIECAWAAVHEGSKSSHRTGDGRNQVSASCSTELIALDIQQSKNHRINRRGGIAEKGLRQSLLGARGGKNRDLRADERSVIFSAALASALVMREEIPQLFRAHRPSGADTENVLA